MKHTLTKHSPMPLSPKHQQSVEKSKAINQKVQLFVNSNFKDSHLSSNQKMAASSASLSNTKAFFESQIKLVMKMVQQSNKLYRQKQSENAELKKKVKDFQFKIAQLEQTANEYTVNKAQKQASKMEEKGEKKTRKKTMNEEGGFCKGLNRTTSEFTLNPDYERLERQWKRKYDMLEQMLREQISKLKHKADDLDEQLKHQKQINLKITEEKTKCAADTAKATFNHNKIQKQFLNLASQHQLLEQRYNQLQNLHGQTVTQYEIKLTNLKSIITGINQKVSPKKQSEKQTQGYYSINKPLNRNQSQQSLESFSSSKYLTPTHAEINLKQENEYLRTQLIRVLDQKGSLQMKANKYKKIAIKYESLVKANKEEQHSISLSQNQNSQYLANLDKAKEIDKSQKSFKKKKQTCILLVEGTEKKQKEILEQQKIIKLLKEISSLVQPNTSQKVGNEIDPHFTQIEFLEIVIARLKENIEEIFRLRRSLKTLEEEKQGLEKEKHFAEQKAKKDADSLKKYLKESGINLTTPKSQDSTDKAFKYINLMQIEQDEGEDDRSHDYEEFSKSMLSHYSQSVAAQQNEVKFLKDKISTLEQTIQNIKKSNQKHSQIAQIDPAVNESRIVPYSPERLHKSHYECKNTECCPFDLFKQKLNQFYQNTIKQLDDWEQKALRTLHYANDLPQIQQEQHQSLSKYRIPVIVQKNIMKMSQEFQSIKNSSFDRSVILQNEEYANVVFGTQKLSKSFIKNQSQGPAETFEEIINKKIQGFNQFSSNWFDKTNTKEADKQDSSKQEIKVEDLRLRQEEGAQAIPRLEIKNGAKTDRSAGNQSYFKVELGEIDAISDWIEDEELMAQRKIFIREEVSYYVQKSEASKVRNLEESISSKKNFKSFQL